MSGLPRLLMAAASLVAAPLAALSDLAPEERAENARKVEKWRADPVVFARFQAEARAFLSLPAPRQEQLVKLDRDLQVLPAATRARLVDVARRYADWLERLPEADRQKVKDAPDPQTRLQRIRELREQEWIRRLPRKQRDMLEKAQGADRAELVKTFRQEERQRRRQWQIAFHHWDELIKKQQLPATLADFPAEVQTFVNDNLRPRLTPDEKAQLDRAEGKWPFFAYTLVRLADQHPMALPGTMGPTQFKDLPADVQTRLASKIKKAGYAALKKEEGKWPGYAIVVTNLARKQGLRLPYELWPARREDLSPAVATFLEKKLVPALNEREKAQLKDAEGRWPGYPRTIRVLAQAHKLPVPWQTLPGPREKWDSYRLRPMRAPLAANPAVLKADRVKP